MLSFLISLVIMFSLVWLGITWAKRKERRLVAAEQADGIEEVLGSARHHR
jgi:hypothetical protein